MTEFKVRLDEKSLEILKQVSPVHSESIINYGIRLVKNTNYFKTLLNEDDVENIEDEVQHINETTNINTNINTSNVTSNQSEIQDLGIAAW